MQEKYPFPSQVEKYPFPSRCVFFRAAPETPPPTGDFTLRRSPFEEGISKFYAAYAARKELASYSQVLFMDGDLTVEKGRLEDLFSAAEGKALVQPAVVGEVNWPVTAPQGKGLRRSGFVEIMCPLFSREALEKVIWTFRLCQSGWGLDFAWAKVLGKENLYVYDDVVVRHPQAVDLENGAFYKKLRFFGVDPMEELAAMDKLFGGFDGKWR